MNRNPAATAGFPAKAQGGNSAPLIRHAALLVAAGAAYVLRAELGIGNGVLWILGATAVANLLVSLLSAHPRLSAISPALSSLAGVAGWAALIHLTGGSGSPFVAGLGLEVVLAASGFGLAGTTAIVLAAIGGLWLQQVGSGYQGREIALIMQSVLLATIGLATALIRQQWSRAHDLALREAVDSRRRLRDLERRLEDLERVGRVGENTARLAHGLKNAVGSLRGFADLIERRLGSDDRAGELAGGLRSSVGRLEEIARLLLGPPDGEPARARDPSPVAPGEVVDLVIERASTRHPEIRWVREESGIRAPLRLHAGILGEILEVLLDNAAEAMKGRGEVHVSTRTGGGALEIRVRDQGDGIAEEDRERLFRPGRTTKPAGSGFGLYLARQLAEAQGGRLEVAVSGGRGASFRVTVPVPAEGR